MIPVHSWSLAGVDNVEKGSSNQLEVGKAKFEESNKLIELATKEEVNLAQILPFTPNDTEPTQVLAAIATHQKQLVAAMVSQNSESAIALALAGSIEAYGKQLEVIQGWTNGGVAMFESALWLMLADLEEGGIQPEELEDVFQIALLEVMINPEKYGLTDWYEKNKEDISHILESTGSGSHGLHEANYDTPKELADVTRKLYEGILSNGNIPEGSLLDQAMDGLEAAGGANELCGQIENNYYQDYGWWDSGASDFSPMLRLFILSESLSQHSTMTQEEVELILNGSVADIDNYINKTFGPGSLGPLTTLSWFCDSTNWQLQEGYNYPGGHTSQVDWKGDGININDLVSLYTNFPQRALTDEELKEVNRIGDQVKMLQQTLKYWIQICRDEQMAIARNI
ncbi:MULTISPECIES: hypothetical protein [Shewanella]|uniref:Uncharacterized protein n=1 Tax=Shewanella psychrophila TaxID=225848 RepID=A0A1S6HQ57_9GAMM|nr:MULTISPECIES: hypothetical protein [Shewanella]AQS37663.1 hypothetical protein Sps_02509 [Shewanella psychrophila]